MTESIGRREPAMQRTRRWKRVETKRDEAQFHGKSRFSSLPIHASTSKMEGLTTH
ncbi:hypothetical protein OH687_33245 [Burkholderia anthina]|nr:hypothetical protein OH687_33245 [Burkholderia anthina]